MSLFDDKGEVKRLLERLVHERDPDVVVERLRKMDFSYIVSLYKRGRFREIELSRDEIEDNWDWRSGKIDESLQEKVGKIIAEF